MRLRARLRRFLRARKGLAALEFAIIAPMMIFLLFGSVDLIDVLGANKRVQNAAASLADVIARDNSVSLTEINELWSALDVLMFPDRAAGMDVRITSVSIESASVARVVWSRANGGGMSARVKGSIIELPEQMMQPGTSIIVAETAYPYTVPLGFLYPGSRTLRHTAYRRSRLVDPIPCTWSGC
jgi:Flp pilus assembly protein TadG